MAAIFSNSSPTTGCSTCGSYSITFSESSSSDFTGSPGCTIVSDDDYVSAVVSVITSGGPTDSSSSTSTFSFRTHRRSWPGSVTIAANSASNIWVARPAITSPDPAWIRSQRARRAALAGVRKRAERRAEGLLRSWLTEKQAADLEEHGWFDVSVPSSDGASRTYRIRRGVAGNVALLGADGRAVKSFCAHPDGVPSPDVMLSQKLMLETDEGMFLRIANARRL